MAYKGIFLLKTPNKRLLSLNYQLMVKWKRYGLSIITAFLAAGLPFLIVTLQNPESLSKDILVSACFSAVVAGLYAVLKLIREWATGYKPVVQN